MSNKNNDKEYQRKYYQAHKADYLRRQQKWQKANPEKCREYYRQYDLKRKELISNVPHTKFNGSAGFKWDKPLPDKIKPESLKSLMKIFINKVYCTNCKWFKRGDDYVCNSCWKVVGYEDMPTHIEKEYANSDIQNKNNNCKYYKRRWWYFWIKEYETINTK